MDTGSRKRRLGESSRVASRRMNAKILVINATMTNEQMFDYWAEKQSRIQSSNTTMDVDIYEFIIALKGVELKLL